MTSGAHLAATSATGRPRRLPVVVVALAGVAVLALLVAVVTAGASTRPPPPAAAAGPTPLAGAPAPHGAMGSPPAGGHPARDVLAAWDARRARAWAHDDVGSLRALYTRSSGAGRADVAMLRRWRARGLRVTGLRLHVRSLRTLARSPGRLVLRVTDREEGATARGRGAVTPLPRDEPSTRRLVLRRERDGPWRMASVADVDVGRGGSGG